MDLVQRAEVDVNSAAESNEAGNPAPEPFRLKGAASRSSYWSPSICARRTSSDV